MMIFEESTKVQPNHSVLNKLIDQHEIVLYNDDVNTFDHVIDTLIDYCDHSAIQAEQCAHIVHFSGKCAVKVGTFDDLKPICSAMLDRGLSAEIF